MFIIILMEVKDWQRFMYEKLWIASGILFIFIFESSMINLIFLCLFLGNYFSYKGPSL